MKQEFKVTIYDMPSINFNIEKDRIQRILIENLDKFVDVEKM